MQSFDLFLNQLNKNISVIIAYVVIRKLFDHREDLHLFAAHDLRNQIVQLLTVSEAERSGFDIVGSDVAISLVAELARGVFPALAWWEVQLQKGRFMIEIFALHALKNR